MNKKMMLSVLGIVALTSSAAFAGMTRGSGVVGSIHDMNIFGATPNPDSEGRVCAFCHTPHHALTGATDEYLPLWSHTLVTGSYTPYESATLDATIDAGTMMEGPSKLCMSCHDGSIAVDTHYATTNTNAIYLSSDAFGDAGIAQSSTNLANDHPIGFVYDNIAGGTAEGDAGGTTNKDNYIKPSSFAFKGNPNITIASRLFARADGSGAIMTCATCHDVHNKKNVDDTTHHNYLLLSSNTNSDLCLSCHIK